MKRATCSVLVIVLAFACFTFAGCFGSKTYYEDDYFVISGFEVEEEAEGFYNAKATVRTKNGAWTEMLMASVLLYDKDGNKIATVAGLANNVPENGSAAFNIALIDEGGFLDKEQVNSIAYYEVENLFTLEGLEYAVDQKSREAEAAEDALRKKYPNEDF